MNKKEVNLIHCFMNQPRDEHGWCTEEKAAKRSYGWHIRAYGETMRYKGPYLYMFDSCLAAIVPSSALGTTVVFHTVVQGTRDGTYLSEGYGGRMTCKVCAEIEQSIPFGQTKIAVPGEVFGYEKPDASVIAHDNFKSIFSYVTQCHEGKWWVRQKERDYWREMILAAKTCINSFPDCASQEQRNAVYRYEEEFDAHFAKKKVDGIPCANYSDWNRRTQLLAEVKKLQRDVKLGRPDSLSVTSHILDNAAGATEVYDAYKSVVEKLTAFLDTPEHVGISHALAAEVRRVLPSKYGWFDDGKTLLSAILKVEFGMEPNHTGNGGLHIPILKTKYDIRSGDIVLPVFVGTTLDRFETTRYATLPGTMREALLTMSAVALKNPSALTGRHIGPYTCSGTDSEGFLLVGCHRFSPQSVQLLHDMLLMPDAECAAYLMKLSGADSTAVEQLEKMNSPAWDQLLADAEEGCKQILDLYNKNRVEYLEEKIKEAQALYNVRLKCYEEKIRPVTA